MTYTTALEALHDVWGYDTFRPLQAEIIDSVLQGRDTLGLLPTGGGKSITFQVPALMLNGLTLIVSPLISLMKDQVDNLAGLGVKASLLHTGMTRRETDLQLDRCHAGVSKMLYVSPERLSSERFRQELAQFHISLIVVDEAHCISQWGYDFRPDYLRIAEVRRQNPHAPVLALTASATPEVTTDIMRQLQFAQSNMFARSFARDNISYIVRRTPHKEPQLLRILTNTSGSAIVYVRSRKRTGELARLLTNNGISADNYHAGLAPEDKNERQNRWKSGETRVMVATNAFGMGIDKADVRVVVHFDPPPTLEEYYQEAGRAGRDGLPSYAVMLAADTDKALMSRRLSEAFPPKEYISRIYELAGNFVNLPVGEGAGRTFDFDFNRFVFVYKLQPAQARAALLLLSRNGNITYSEDAAASARVMMTIERRALYDVPMPPEADNVLQVMLRSYTGLFSDYVNISENVIARRANLSTQQVYEALLLLTRMHVLHYIPRRLNPCLHYPVRREEPRYVQLSREVYQVRRAVAEQRMQAMRDFAFDGSTCRVERMLRYFGDATARPCGKCDVCRDRRDKRLSDEQTRSLEASLQYLFGQSRRPDIEHIMRQLCPQYSRERIIDTIRRMADEGLLDISGLF